MWGAAEGIIRLLARFCSLLDSRGAALSAAFVLPLAKIALGLDFFLAGDIIQTIIIPSWESLAILGGKVDICTIIAFFLNRDIKEFAEK